eukprot:Sdes_comp20908_c0_seq1m18138
MSRNYEYPSMHLPGPSYMEQAFSPRSLLNRNLGLAELLQPLDYNCLLENSCGDAGCFPPTSAASSSPCRNSSPTSSISLENKMARWNSEFCSAYGSLPETDMEFTDLDLNNSRSFVDTSLWTSSTQPSNPSMSSASNSPCLSFDISPEIHPWSLQSVRSQNNTVPAAAYQSSEILTDHSNLELFSHLENLNLPTFSHALIPPPSYYSTGDVPKSQPNSSFHNSSLQDLNNFLVLDHGSQPSRGFLPSYTPQQSIIERRKKGKELSKKPNLSVNVPPVPPSNPPFSVEQTSNNTFQTSSSSSCVSNTTKILLRKKLEQHKKQKLLASQSLPQ